MVHLAGESSNRIFDELLKIRALISMEQAAKGDQFLFSDSA